MEKPMDSNYKLFIGGEWVDGAEGKTFGAYCPANGELLATCVNAGAEDVDRAVKAAEAAFPAWSATSAGERQRMLTKIADLIEANVEKLAMIETMNTGKPIGETRRGEIPGSADHFRYFGAIIRADEGQATMLNKDTMSVILHEPLGVVGLIVPWNFPMWSACSKIAPALAAGNCVVIKPSSATSLSLLELAKLVSEVLPPGVLNVITGQGSSTGNAMLEHPGFRKFSFTGSTEVGYSVADAAAKKLIPATLELGGKSANIFFPDCPWEKAIEGLQIGILSSQGEVCCAGSRVFVHEEIYDRFMEAAIAAFEKIKVGIPWEPGAKMGALISESHLNKVLGYVELGKQEGATVATGGYRITDGELANGFFMAPTLLTDVDNKMRVAQEEIFGPVAVVIKFKTEDEVIRMANDSPYGLAGAVWTMNINRALRVARGVDTGRMWVNCYNVNLSHSPFGGYKKSGYGRETHKMTLEHFTQTKNIIISMVEGKMGRY